MFLVFAILAISFVFANNNCIPNTNPNEFYGDVYVGDNLLDWGEFKLIAKIGEDIVGDRIIESDGSYTIDISPCQGITSGLIDFYVGDAKATESGTYSYNGSSVILVELDLHLDKEPYATCGNGRIDGPDECDDGNTNSGDGCSGDICEVELGYTCKGGGSSPSVCESIYFCGDGYCNNGETCSTCATDCGSCPSSPGGGGSSGGGGGSSSSKDKTIVLSASCTEDWECIDWSECELGFQNRICEDKNNCGTDEDKPEERRACTAFTTGKEEPSNTGFFSFITGGAIGGTSGGIIAAVVIVILIIVAVWFVKYKKKS
jgi:cysteine-rich repeat protein